MAPRRGQEGAARRPATPWRSRAHQRGRIRTPLPRPDPKPGRGPAGEGSDSKSLRDALGCRAGLARARGPGPGRGRPAGARCTPHGSGAAGPAPEPALLAPLRPPGWRLCDVSAPSPRGSVVTTECDGSVASSWSGSISCLRLRASSNAGHSGSGSKAQGAK